ncbi:hypothetical protein Pan97_23800 [Bremerella volcania]|uniref:Uncharacterized protein n=1 Tax=Bremerella volcania TaxID=2527984 RepID=A0A518C821_9BACT|nr:hypothetical protein [Bremerella volcania]QDU75350.1 hypothetical protein Pan97_23800 [Bremerella volcania]
MSTYVPPSREEMVGRFWMDVRTRLTKVFELSEERADMGIGRYRYETELREIGDAVYNQGVELTADIVNDVILNGRPRDMSWQRESF